MRNWITYSFLILFIIISISCEKQRGTFTQVKGKVLEHGSGIPVKNALVKLVKLTYYTFNVTETILDTVRSAKDGSYFFSLDTEADDFELLVFAETNNHFHHNLSSAVSQPKLNILRGVNQHADISIIPFAYLKITAINSLGNDLAWINRIKGSRSVLGFEIWEGIEKTRRTYGNMEVSIYSFLRKNNLQTAIVPYTVNTIAGDTCEVIIQY